MVDEPGTSTIFFILIMLYNKNMKSEVRIFYYLSFLGGLFYNITAPLFVVYGLSLGFTIAKVGILFGAMKISTFIFEVPTGIIADTYGRKKSILFAYALSGVSALIYFTNTDFFMLLLGSLIAGIALTFISGAFEALTVDSLNLSKDDKRRNRAFVWIGIASTIGFIVGGVVGSGVAFLNLKYIWLVQALIALIAFLLGIMFLKETRYQKSESITQASGFLKLISRQAKTALVSILNNRKILWIFSFTVLFSFANAVYHIAWPIIFKDILMIPIHYFGVIASAAGVFYLLGSLATERYARKTSTLRVLVISLFSMTAGFIIFIVSRNVILSLLCFMLIDFFNGGFQPLFYSLLNIYIPSKERATILSYYSLTTAGTSGAGEIIAGYLLLIVSAPIVLVLSPLLIGTGLGFFIKLKED